MLSGSAPAVTVANYLELERAAKTRSDFRAGAMAPRAISNVKHAMIAGSALASLVGLLKRGEFSAFGADLRLFVKHHHMVTYPDLFVARSPFQVLDAHQDTLTDAILIVEIVSPDTKNYDRGDKFRYYQA